MQFAQIPGNTDVKFRIIRAIRAGHVPHAQLYLSRPGAPALAMALAAVQYQLCQWPGETDSCGTCSNCRSVQKLEHPDLHLAFPIILGEGSRDNSCSKYLPEFREVILNNPYVSASGWRNSVWESNKNKQLTFGVAQAEEVIQKLILKSFSGGQRLMVLWLPEFMNNEAANKLLKTIEEPEPGIFIYLVCNDVSEMLPTVLSRTQMVKVLPPSITELANWLTANSQIEPDMARTLSARVRGNVGLALELLLSDAGERENFDFLQVWLRLCYSQNLAELVTLSEKFGALSREVAKSRLAYFSEVLSQTLWAHQVGKPPALPDYQQKFIVQLAPYLVTFLRELIHQLDELYYHLERNASARMAFFNLSIDTARNFYFSQRQSQPVPATRGN